MFYLHARLLAAKYGWGLSGEALRRNASPTVAPGPLPAEFINAGFLQPHDAVRFHATNELPVTCEHNDYKQEYPFLRYSRAASRCILKVAPALPPPVGPDDEVIVIHFRDSEREFGGDRAL